MRSTGAIALLLVPGAVAQHAIRLGDGGINGISVGGGRPIHGGVLSGGPIRINSDGRVAINHNTVVVDQAGPPSDCVTWFDGCNTCAVANGRHICTEMACKTRQTPYCQEYTDGRTCEGPNDCALTAVNMLPSMPPARDGCGRCMMIDCAPPPGGCRFVASPMDRCGCSTGCGALVCTDTDVVVAPSLTPATDSSVSRPAVSITDGPVMTSSDGTVLLGAPTDSADSLNAATDCTLSSITFALTPIGTACASTDLSDSASFCQSRCYRLLRGTPAFMECLSNDATGSYSSSFAQPLLTALTGCATDGH